MIAKTDVFVHNARAETAVALQIDYDASLRHNPRLVYASASGFGSCTWRSYWTRMLLFAWIRF